MLNQQMLFCINKKKNKNGITCILPASPTESFFFMGMVSAHTVHSVRGEERTARGIPRLRNDENENGADHQDRVPCPMWSARRNTLSGTLTYRILLHFFGNLSESLIDIETLFFM